MQVVYYDIETKLALGNARPMPSLDAVLKIADVVTLHVPETPQTNRMIGAAQLARMKEGARLINASRGTVVDIDALVEALRSKRLSGAAVDVFPTEPKTAADEFVSPLRGFDNVILTPHVGGSTEEAQQNIGIEVAEKLIKYSNNGSTLSAVNFPEVSLPEHPGKHRLLHIHRNQPGVLSGINAIFSEQQDQHRRPVPADQRQDRLRRDRHRNRDEREETQELKRIGWTRYPQPYAREFSIDA